MRAQNPLSASRSNQNEVPKSLVKVLHTNQNIDKIMKNFRKLQFGYKCDTRQLKFYLLHLSSVLLDFCQDVIFDLGHLINGEFGYQQNSRFQQTLHPQDL